jgi:hypothetical protein
MGGQHPARPRLGLGLPGSLGARRDGASPSLAGP